MKNILCVGEMLIDFLPGSEKASYVRKAGGAPANVAIAVARQGCGSAFCGMMGDDDFGRFLLNTLIENNVTPCITELTKKAVTTMAFVSLDGRGERSFTFARKPGADMFLTKEHITDAILNKADVVHAGSCSLSAGDAAAATRYALEEGHKRGKLVSFDVNYRNLMWNDDIDAAAQAVFDILPYVDLLKISDEEADMLGGEENLGALAEKYGISLIVETLGSKGCRALFRGEAIFCGGISSECVDSCGAGDAFWGGFLATLMKAGAVAPEKLDRELIAKATRRGNISGALCVREKGAIESLPTAKQVDEFEKKMQ